SARNDIILTADNGTITIKGKNATSRANISSDTGLISIKAIANTHATKAIWIGSAVFNGNVSIFGKTFSNQGDTYYYEGVNAVFLTGSLLFKHGTVNISGVSEGQGKGVTIYNSPLFEISGDVVMNISGEVYGSDPYGYAGGVFIGLTDSSIGLKLINNGVLNIDGTAHASSWNGTGVSFGTYNQYNPASYFDASFTGDGQTYVNGKAGSGNGVAVASNLSIAGGGGIDLTGEAVSKGVVIAANMSTKETVNLNVSGTSQNSDGVYFVKTSVDAQDSSNFTISGSSVKGNGVNLGNNKFNSVSVSAESDSGSGLVVSNGNISNSQINAISGKGIGINVSGNTSLNNTKLIGDSTNSTGVTVTGNLTSAGNTTVAGNATGNGIGVDLGGNVTGGRITGNSASGSGVTVSGS
ncbi:hypothetical protein DFT97_004758, partial [Salmonella enterica subsp. enterica serovar Newport]|nr:hypothetical protein [Salmonella enterica subsp. enterica serovar Newport]